jgi:hypothetical protein
LNVFIFGPLVEMAERERALGGLLRHHRLSRAPEVIGRPRRRTSARG